MGGAGGHMRHPHDLNEVSDGKDLIALFRAIPAYLKSKEFKAGESSSLKLDGSNNGLRLAYRDGKYQFVVDRGTKRFLDIQGVSIDQLEDRFHSKVITDPKTGEEITKQHGMVESSAALLDMMNDGLESDPDEMFSVLKELGFLSEKDNRLIPDPAKYISIEFVERTIFDHPTNPELGKANVIYYPYDFIAFHGVSEFFEMILKRTGEVVRQGPKAGPEDSGPGNPIPYNRAALNKLVELVTPHAPAGFKVFAPISLKVAMAAGEDITDEGDDDAAVVDRAIKQLSANIEEALNTNIAIRTSTTLPPTTKTLEGWLSDPAFKNFDYKPLIRLKSLDKKGKVRRVNPFHKDVHDALIKQQVSVVNYVDDPEIGQEEECPLSGDLYDCEKAIYGAIFIEAARILGNTVKKSLMPAVEEFGSAVSHEGIVIDAGMPFGKKKTGHAFKITGEFIIDARGGTYATNPGESRPGLREEEEPSVELDIVDSSAADPIGSGAGTDTIAIVPGAFKPPHLGHVRMVEHYASEADKVIVLISNPLKNQRTLADGTVISASVSKQIWELLIAHLPNVEVKISDSASPITATYGFIGKNGPVKPGSEIILGVCTKGNDIARYKQVSRYVKEGVVIRSIEACAVAPAQHSAEYMFLLGNSPLGEEMPSVLAHEKDPRNFHASDMRYLLGKATEDEEAVELLEDFIGDPDKIDDVLSILNIDTGATMPIDEISSASGGAAPFGLSTWGSKKKKERQNKYIDTSLVNEVYKLIIERGIIQ